MTSMSAQPVRFQLFLDESGDFRETSTNPDERALTGNSKYPSQLAGLLVPYGQLTADSATRLLHATCAAAGQTYIADFHATKFGREALDEMLQHLLPELGHRRWQPVRMTNRERVAFGDRVTTYTNLVAELTLRCFQMLRLEGFRNVEIELHCAGVWDEALQDTFKKSDYQPRLTEVIARASIRAGQAEQQRSWRVSNLYFRSGKRDPELHLCDLLSNSSKADFERLAPATGAAFRTALGRYDLTLLVLEDLQRIDQLASDGATAMALIALAERIFDRNLDPRLRSSLQHRLTGLVDDLAALGAPARDPQLEVIGNFLEQTITWERDLERGLSHCDWFLRQVAIPLRERLPELERHEGDWFQFQLHLHALSAANHLGDLGAAKTSSDALSALQGSMVQRWERLDLFLQAQVHVAVHLTDCRELPSAIDTAERVSAFHDGLSDLFHAAMPDRLPEGVRSRRSGEALGTAMQAATLAGLQDAAQFEKARNLGDRALKEFDNSEDWRRQYQYRCQLETLARDLPAARTWLAKALDLADPRSHSLGQAIAQTRTGSTERGFLLLHWLRFGAVASIADPVGAEANDFRASWSTAGMVSDPWCTGVLKDHPAPSILRYLGEVQVHGGDEAAAVGTLRTLREIVLPFRREQALLGLPLLGLQSAVYLQLVPSRPERARPLLDNNDKAAPGLTQLIETLATSLKGFPEWTRTLLEWRNAVTALHGKDSARNARQDLQDLARRLAF